MIREWLGKKIGFALSRAAELQLLPHPRVIWDREGRRKYLSRYYLIGGARMPDGSSAFDEYGSPKKGAVFDDRWPFHLYLHRFHRGDDDLDLHNHPWRWSVSLILSGGYVEEKRVRDSKDKPTSHVFSRVVGPLCLNVIHGDDFHRVDLLEKEAWSLFLAGPHMSSWSFWDRETGETVPWREFIARKRG